MGPRHGGKDGAVPRESSDDADYMLGMHIRPSTLAGAEPVPVKPTVVDPPAGMVAFQASLENITIDPLGEYFAPHAWLMVCPAGKLKCTIQPFTAAVPARTVTEPWNPPDQLLVTEKVALQAPPGFWVGGVEVGGVDVGGREVGGVEGGVDVGGVDGSGLGGGTVVSPIPVTWPLPPSKTTSEQP